MDSSYTAFVITILVALRYLIFMTALASLLQSACNTEKPDGVQTVYFPQTEIIKQTVEYRDGKKNGWIKNFYPNGNLKAKQRVVNDTVVDTSFYYHENGNIS